MRNSKPKLHHYLPQFYLKGFGGPDGFLRVFDRKSREFRRQMPIVTAVEKDFYAIVDADGTKHTDLEEKLGKIEGCVAPLMDSMIAGKAFAQDDKAYVADFIALMSLRTPGFRRNRDALHAQQLNMQLKDDVPDLAAAERVIERMKADGEDVSIYTAEKVLKAAETADNYRITFSSMYSLRTLIRLTPKFGRFLAHMQWTICHAPKNKAFITSDEPFVAFPPPRYRERSEGAHSSYVTPGVPKYLPLSQRACLMMVPGVEPAVTPIRHTAAPPDFVRHVNECLARRCERFLVGHNELLVRSIVRATRMDRTESDLTYRLS